MSENKPAYSEYICKAGFNSRGNRQEILVCSSGKELTGKEESRIKIKLILESYESWFRQLNDVLAMIYSDIKNML